MKDTELKKLILEIIRDGDGDASRFLIGEELEKRTGKRISTGTLILTFLKRMEEENLIVSEKRRGGAQRGFRDKTCYRLTGHGLAEIKPRSK